MPAKIIIVDDEIEMAQLVKLELELEGFDVDMAHDGKVGLEMIQGSKPDLVILDVMMPEMNGYEVLKILKAEESTKSIPVFMLTAKGLKDEMQKGMDLGAYDYIPKPFDAEVVIEKIKAVLNT